MPLDRRQGRLGFNRWETIARASSRRWIVAPQSATEVSWGDAWRVAIDGGARTSRRGACDIRINFLQSYAEEK